ncbi:MAG: hypothetical protein JXA18_01545 [Chitinispirillaceae bacterium]|nr:hypothetical protein [Chitinispirillaceae bacterium]
MINVQCAEENNGFKIIDELTKYLKLNMISYQYMSLPFPASWPIKGKPTAYFFGFKGTGLNTGIPAHDLVVSPSVVVMECESDGQINLSLKVMGSIALGKESSRISELKDTVFASAVGVFHRIIACNEGKKEVIDELRKVYQAWMTTFPNRCDFIKKYSPEFIDWVLDKNNGANFDLTNDPPRYFKRKGIVVE